VLKTMSFKAAGLPGPPLPLAARHRGDSSPPDTAKSTCIPFPILLECRPMLLKVKKLVDEAILPAYAHAGDAGLDLFSAQQACLGPGEARCISTGISIELPAGTEAQVRPRSGLALKHGVTVLNAPGTVDEGYRGEVGVILVNHGREEFRIEKGMKIAQMVVKPVIAVRVEESRELSDTSRGEGGFGSTGDGVPG
jgi:dUTP pyrophosphatase